MAYKVTGKLNGKVLAETIRETMREVKAIEKAYEFFKDYRREDGLMIFECGSWLLWDGYKEFLPEKSNTIKFINDFELVTQGEKKTFSDAWRVFGKAGYGRPKNCGKSASD